MVCWSDQWWQTDGSSNQQPHAFWNELWNTFHWQLPPDGCVEPIIWLIVLTNSKRSSLTRRTDGNFESLLSKLFPSQPELVFTTLPSPSPKKKKEEISCYFSFFCLSQNIWIQISVTRFLSPAKSALGAAIAARSSPGVPPRDRAHQSPRPQRERRDEQNREINTCSSKARDWQRGALIHHDDGALLEDAEHPQ